MVIPFLEARDLATVPEMSVMSPQPVQMSPVHRAVCIRVTVSRGQACLREGTSLPLTAQLSKQSLLPVTSISVQPLGQPVFTWLNRSQVCSIQEQSCKSHLKYQGTLAARFLHFSSFLSFRIFQTCYDGIHELLNLIVYRAGLAPDDLSSEYRESPHTSLHLPLGLECLRS